MTPPKDNRWPLILAWSLVVGYFVCWTFAWGLVLYVLVHFLSRYW